MLLFSLTFASSQATVPNTSYSALSVHRVVSRYPLTAEDVFASDFCPGRAITASKEIKGWAIVCSAESAETRRCTLQVLSLASLWPLAYLTNSVAHIGRTREGSFTQTPECFKYLLISTLSLSVSDEVLLFRGIGNTRKVSLNLCWTCLRHNDHFLLFRYGKVQKGTILLDNVSLV